MIDFIEAICHPTPLNSHPTYDDDSDTWEVWFEEREDFNPYGLDNSPICVSLDTLAEAQKTIQQALALAYNEEDTTED